MSRRAEPHLFIQPESNDFVSGGNLYNRRLLEGLEHAGVAACALSADAALERLRAGAPGTYWLDSLWLARFPELARARTASHAETQRLGLVLHYLPSLVAHGESVSESALSAAERAALRGAELVLTSGNFMRHTAARLGARARAILVIEPGLPEAPRTRPPTPQAGVRAVLVANLVPGKGVEALLRALVFELQASDRFELRILGSRTLDRQCASACEAVVAAHPTLSARVEFLGEQPPADVARWLTRSNLFVSSSRMESYGMALAEARHWGLPIVALRGGNVAEHVESAAGGELFETERALAQRCAALARDPVEHEARLAAASAQRSPPRPWSRAAAEFIAAMAAEDARSTP